jgi:hypothetical protein
MIPAILGGTLAVTSSTAGWVASSTSATVTAPLVGVGVGPVFGGLGAAVATPFGGAPASVALTPFGGPSTLTVVI